MSVGDSPRLSTVYTVLLAALQKQAGIEEAAAGSANISFLTPVRHCQAKPAAGVEELKARVPDQIQRRT